MVLKTFLTRKNTKIYFIIILLMSILYALANTLNSYYIKMNNENFNGSYIFIPNIHEKELKSNNEISEMLYVKKDKNSTNSQFFVINENIADNVIDVSTRKYNLIKELYEQKSMKINPKYECDDDLLYLNSKTYDLLNIDGLDGYYIKLLDWSCIDNIINKYSSAHNDMEIRYSEQFDQHILGLTKIIKTFIVIIKIIIIAIYLFILIDLVLDGKNKADLFYTLGTKKTYIIKITLYEFSVYILEFILCYIFFSLIISNII